MRKTPTLTHPRRTRGGEKVERRLRYDRLAGSPASEDSHAGDNHRAPQAGSGTSASNPLAAAKASSAAMSLALDAPLLKLAAR